MEARTAATRVPDPDAVEFIRFCYRRRRVGWPELYDEMCAVAARGLFRGLGSDDLAAHGIGFSLYDTPALAAAASQIVAEEQALRRPVTVLITSVVESEAPGVETRVEFESDPAPAAPVAIPIAPAAPANHEASPQTGVPTHLVAVPAGA